MAPRYSSSQMKSKFKQIENKMKNDLRKAENQFKHEVREVNSAINNYNREVRKYNNQVKSNRQRMNSALNKLNSLRTIQRYTLYTTSSVSLNNSFSGLATNEEVFMRTETGKRFYELSENENANSLELAEALECDDNEDLENDDIINNQISNILIKISEELDKRWKGALFSLNPNNPDAARHFCTSAREVYIQILDIKAPDNKVLEFDENCEKTEEGTPTRKSKIMYMLSNAGLSMCETIKFVDDNVDNVLKLFRVFNDGTHGRAGKFGYHKLKAIKKRVEDGIIYLNSIG